jgi:hypothetical protein
MYNSTSIDSITNDLILKYKEKYNKLYEEKELIDFAIMNKNEIILKENEEIKLKDVKINTLKYLFILSLFICAFIILYSMDIFKIFILILGIIGLIIIFSILIYFGNRQIYKFDKTLDDIDMPYYLSSKSKNNDNKFKCPAKCNPNKKSNLILDEEDLNNPNNPNNPNYRYNTQGFGSGDNNYIPDNLIYYKCDWIGGNNYSGVGKDNIKYSPIPCKYKQNFTQTGKYICLSDPNNPKTDFYKSCKDVTYYNTLNT